ncbi:MAG: ABC transporter permease, partial [Neobacillus sp.]
MRRQSIQKFLNNKLFAYIVAGIFLVVSILLGISIGTVSVPMLTIIQIIGAKLAGMTIGSIDPMYSSIVMDIRLPRVILSGL